MSFLFTNSKAMHAEILDGLMQLDEILKPLFKHIKKGTILRDLTLETYQARITYTNALRRFVYNPAVFNEILLSERLKEKFFQTFGYLKHLDFTLYPNAWIRDLALEDYSIGQGVYLADGIVLGTNQVTPCQTKLKVGPIKIGDKTVFDQNCKIGLKTTIGAHCIIGISCHIGLITTIGHHVKIGPLSNVGHCVKLGNNVTIGAQCTVGSASVIEEEAIIKDYMKIPQNSFVNREGKIHQKFTLTI